MHSISSKRKSNEYVNLSLTLFGITFVVAVLLALVNFVTSDKITLMKQEKLEQAMAAVLPDAISFEDVTQNVLNKWDGDTDVLCVQLAKNSSGDTIGYCVEVAPKGYSDAIDMMVGLNIDGEVTNTSIISLTDTPGIGTQIKEKEFLEQFVGKSGVLTAVKGNSTRAEEVALISGASYSSGGFTKGVNAALQVYMIIAKEGV